MTELAELSVQIESDYKEVIGDANKAKKSLHELDQATKKLQGSVESAGRAFRETHKSGTSTADRIKKVYDQIQKAQEMINQGSTFANQSQERMFNNMRSRMEAAMKSVQAFTKAQNDFISSSAQMSRVSEAMKMYSKDVTKVEEATRSMSRAWRESIQIKNEAKSMFRDGLIDKSVFESAKTGFKNVTSEYRSFLRGIRSEFSQVARDMGVGGKGSIFPSGLSSYMSNVDDGKRFLESLKRMKAGSEVVIADLESTVRAYKDKVPGGGSVPAGKIWNLGAVRYRKNDKGGWEEVGRKEWYVDPGEPLVATTHPDRDRLNEKYGKFPLEKIREKAGDMTYKRMLQEFSGFVGNSTLMGHNLAYFDYPKINLHNKEYGLPLLNNDVIDTLSMSRALGQQGLIPGSFPKNLRGQTSMSLQDLAKGFGIGSNGMAHTAIADVLTNAVLGLDKLPSLVSAGSVANKGISALESNLKQAGVVVEYTDDKIRSIMMQANAAKGAAATGASNAEINMGNGVRTKSFLDSAKRDLDAAISARDSLRSIKSGMLKEIERLGAIDDKDNGPAANQVAYNMSQNAKVLDKHINDLNKIISGGRIEKVKGSNGADYFNKDFVGLERIVSQVEKESSRASSSSSEAINRATEKVSHTAKVVSGVNSSTAKLESRMAGGLSSHISALKSAINMYSLGNTIGDSSMKSSSLEDMKTLMGGIPDLLKGRSEFIMGKPVFSASEVKKQGQGVNQKFFNSSDVTAYLSREAQQLQNLFDKASKIAGGGGDNSSSGAMFKLFDRKELSDLRIGISELEKAYIDLRRMGKGEAFKNVSGTNMSPFSALLGGSDQAVDRINSFRSSVAKRYSELIESGSISPAMQKSYESFLSQMNALDNRVTSLSGKMGTVAESYKKSTSSAHTLSDAHRKLVSTTGELQSIFGMFAAVGATAFYKNIAATGIEFERVKATMQAAFKGKDPNGEIEYVRKYADSIGAQYNALITPYARLGVSTKAAGASDEDLKSVFQGVATVTTGLGMTQEGIKGTLRAFEQMYSKGKVMAEELRLQLGDRIPGAVVIFAKAFHGLGADAVITTEQMRAFEKAMKDGLVDTMTVAPKAAKILEETFGEAAAYIAKTVPGAINRMHNAFADLSRRVFDGGLSDALINFHDALSNLFKNDSFSGILINISKGFSLIAEAAKNSTNGLLALGVTVSTLFGTILAAKIALFVTALGPATLGVLALVSAVAGLASYLAITNGLFSSTANAAKNMSAWADANNKYANNSSVMNDSSDPSSSVNRASQYRSEYKKFEEETSTSIAGVATAISVYVGIQAAAVLLKHIDILGKVKNSWIAVEVWFRATSIMESVSKVGMLTTAMNGLLAVMRSFILTPVGLVAAAIGALTYMVVSSKSHIQEIRDSIGPAGLDDLNNRSSGVDKLGQDEVKTLRSDLSVSRSQALRRLESALSEQSRLRKGDTWGDSFEALFGLNKANRTVFALQDGIKEIDNNLAKVNDSSSRFKSNLKAIQDMGKLELIDSKEIDKAAESIQRMWSSVSPMISTKMEKEDNLRPLDTMLNQMSMVMARRDQALRDAQLADDGVAGKAGMGMVFRYQANSYTSDLADLESKAGGSYEQLKKLKEVIDGFGSLRNFDSTIDTTLRLIQAMGLLSKEDMEFTKFKSLFDNNKDLELFKNRLLEAGISAGDLNSALDYLGKAGPQAIKNLLEAGGMSSKLEQLRNSIETFGMSDSEKRAYNLKRGAGDVPIPSTQAKVAEAAALGDVGEYLGEAKTLTSSLKSKAQQASRAGMTPSEAKVADFNDTLGEADRKIGNLRKALVSLKALPVGEGDSEVNRKNRILAIENQIKEAEEARGAFASKRVEILGREISRYEELSIQVRKSIARHGKDPLGSYSIDLEDEASLTSSQRASLIGMKGVDVALEKSYRDIDSAKTFIESMTKKVSGKENYDFAEFDEQIESIKKNTNSLIEAQSKLYSIDPSAAAQSEVYVAKALQENIDKTKTLIGLRLKYFDVIDSRNNKLLKDQDKSFKEIDNEAVSYGLTPNEKKLLDLEQRKTKAREEVGNRWNADEDRSKWVRLTVGKGEDRRQETDEEFIQRMENTKNTVTQKVQETYDAAERARTNVLLGLKGGIEEYYMEITSYGKAAEQSMGKVMRGMEDSLVKWATTGKMSAKDLFNTINEEITRMLMRKAVMEPLSMGMNGLFSSMGSWFASANGNVFMNNSPVTAFANGGVVSGPTAFKMASGMGLMGEAGAEAIMPLRRLSNGRLGVEASGGGGTVVQAPVNINIIDNRSNSGGNNQKPQVQEKQNADGSRDISIIIEDTVNKGMKSGSFDKSMQSTWGMRRDPIRR